MFEFKAFRVFLVVCADVVNVTRDRFDERRTTHVHTESTTV